MSPETQYLIDSATELGELSPIEFATLELNPLILEQASMSAYLGEDWLANLAREHFSTLNQVEQDFIVLFGMQESICKPLYEALTGRLQHLVERKVALDLGWTRATPSLDGENGLWGKNCAPVFTSEQDITEPQVNQYMVQRFENVRRRWESDCQALGGALVRARENWDALQRLIQEKFAVCYAIPQPDLENQQWKDFTKELKQQQKKAQRAVKKAFKLFSLKGQDDRVKLLISGEDVVISHPSSEFKFVVKPHSAGWLLSKTTNVSGATAPFTIELLTKDDIYLAKLCVYFKDTPVLDQLMALSLYIESGCEQDVLRTANWFGASEKAHAYLLETQTDPEILSKVQSRESAEQAMELSLSLQTQAQRNWAPYENLCKGWVVNAMAQTMPTLGFTPEAFGRQIRIMREQAFQLKQEFEQIRRTQKDRRQELINYDEQFA